MSQIVLILIILNPAYWLFFVILLSGINLEWNKWTNAVSSGWGISTNIWHWRGRHYGGHNERSKWNNRQISGENAEHVVQWFRRLRSDKGIFSFPTMSQIGLIICMLYPAYPLFFAMLLPGINLQWNKWTNGCSWGQIIRTNVWHGRGTYREAYPTA